MLDEPTTNEPIDPAVEFRKRVRRESDMRGSRGAEDRIRAQDETAKMEDYRRRIAERTGQDYEPLSQQAPTGADVGMPGWDLKSGAQMAGATAFNVALSLNQVAYGTGSTVVKAAEWLPRLITKAALSSDLQRKVDNGEFENIDDAFEASWGGPLNAMGKWFDKQLGLVGETRQELLKVQGEIISEQFGEEYMAWGLNTNKAITQAADMVARIKTMQAITGFAFGGSSAPLAADMQMKLKAAKILGATSKEGMRQMLSLNKIRESATALKAVAQSGNLQLMGKQALSVARSAPILALMTPQEGTQFDPVEYMKTAGRSAAFLGTTIFSPLMGVLAKPTDILLNTAVSMAFNEFNDTQRSAYQSAIEMGFDEETAYSMSQAAYWTVHVMNIYYGSKTTGHTGQRAKAETSYASYHRLADITEKSVSETERVVDMAANTLKAAKINAAEEHIAKIERESRPDDPETAARIEIERTRIGEIRAQENKDVLAELIALREDSGNSKEAVRVARMAADSLETEANQLESDRAGAFGGVRESMKKRESALAKLRTGTNVERMPDLIKGMEQGGEDATKAFEDFRARVKEELTLRKQDAKASKIDKVKPSTVFKYAKELSDGKAGSFNAMFHKEAGEFRKAVQSGMDVTLKRDNDNAAYREQEAATKVEGYREGSNIIRAALPELAKDVERAKADAAETQAIDRNTLEEHSIGRYDSFKSFGSAQSEAYGAMLRLQDQARAELDWEANDRDLAQRVSEMVRDGIGYNRDAMSAEARAELDRVVGAGAEAGAKVEPDAAKQGLQATTDKGGRTVITDNIGGRAVVKIDDGVVRIIDIQSVPSDKRFTDEADSFKRRGFLASVINKSQDMGANKVKVALQSGDTRAALARLVEKGILENPREDAGISVDRHPTLFDISKPVAEPTREAAAEPTRDVASPERVQLAQEFVREVEETVRLAETGDERHGTPVINAIRDLGGIKLPARKMGKKIAGQEYDDAPLKGQLSKTVRDDVFPTKGLGGAPDKVAQALQRDGVLPDGDVGTLFEAIRAESQTVRDPYPEDWYKRRVNRLKTVLKHIEQGKKLTEEQTNLLDDAVKASSDLEYQRTGIEVPAYALEGREASLSELKDSADYIQSRVTETDISDGDLVWRNGELYFAKDDPDAFPSGKELIDGEKINVGTGEEVRGATLVIKPTDPQYAEAMREYEVAHPERGQQAREDVLRLESLTPEQQAELAGRLEAEAQGREQREQMAEREAAPLEGTRGDIGQRDMFGDEDLFARDPSAEPERTAEPAADMGGDRVAAYMRDAESAVKDFTLSQRERYMAIALRNLAPAIEQNVETLAADIGALKVGIERRVNAELATLPKLDKAEDDALMRYYWARQRQAQGFKDELPKLPPKLAQLQPVIDKLIRDVFDVTQRLHAENGLAKVQEEAEYFPLVRIAQIVGQHAVDDAIRNGDMQSWLDITENPFLFHNRDHGVVGYERYRHSATQNLRDYLTASYYWHSLHDKNGFGHKLSGAIRSLNMELNSPSVIDARHKWHQAQADRGMDTEPRTDQERQGQRLDQHIDKVQQTLKDNNVEAGALQLPDRDTNDILAEHANYRSENPGRMKGISIFEKEMMNPWLLMAKIDGKSTKDLEWGVSMKTFSMIQDGVSKMEPRRMEMLRAITGERGLFERLYGTRMLGVFENKALDRRLTAIQRYAAKNGVEMTEKSAKEYAEIVSSEMGRDVQDRDVVAYVRMVEHLRGLHETYADDLKAMSSLRGVAYKSPTMNRNKADRSFFSGYEVLVNRLAHASTQSKNIHRILALANFYKAAGNSHKDDSLKNVGEYWEDYAKIGLAHGLHQFDQALANLGQSNQRAAMHEEKTVWSRMKNAAQQPGMTALNALHWTNQTLSTMFLAGAPRWTLTRQWTSLAMVAPQTGAVNFARGMAKNTAIMFSELANKVGLENTTIGNFLGELSEGSRYHESVGGRIKMGETGGGFAAAEAEYRQTKLTQTVMQRVGGFSNKFAKNMEWATGAAAYQAAEYEARRLGMTGERAEYFKNSVVAATQSMYNRESRALLLNSMVFRAAFPFQTFTFDAFSGLWDSVLGQDKKLTERGVAAVNIASSIFLTNVLSELLFKRKAIEATSLIPILGTGRGPAPGKRDSVVGAMIARVPAIDVANRTIVRGLQDGIMKDDWTRLQYELPPAIIAGAGLPGAQPTKDAIRIMQTLTNNGFIQRSPHDMGVKVIDDREYIAMLRDIGEWIFATGPMETTTAREVGGEARTRRAR